MTLPFIILVYCYILLPKIHKYGTTIVFTLYYFSLHYTPTFSDGLGATTNNNKFTNILVKLNVEILMILHYINSHYANIFVQVICDIYHQQFTNIVLHNFCLVGLTLVSWTFGIAVVSFWIWLILIGTHLLTLCLRRFFQMVWEQGSVVIVNLTRLTENTISVCHRYWPEEGSDLYHIYEVTPLADHSKWPTWLIV